MLQKWLIQSGSINNSRLGDLDGNGILNGIDLAMLRSLLIRWLQANKSEHTRKKYTDSDFPPGACLKNSYICQNTHKSHKGNTAQVLCGVAFTFLHGIPFQTTESESFKKILSLLQGILWNLYIISSLSAIRTNSLKSGFKDGIPRLCGEKFVHDVSPPTIFLIGEWIICCLELKETLNKACA